MQRIDGASSLAGALLLMRVAGGCSSPSAQHAEATATATANDVPAEPTAPATPTTPSTTAGAPSASTGLVASAPAGTACLMWQVCGCNEGCVGIPIPAADLHEGMRTRVISGTPRGREGFVAKGAQLGGGETFILTDADPHAPHTCGFRTRSPLFGYMCEVSRSGPVPKDACASGCP